MKGFIGQSLVNSVHYALKPSDIIISPEGKKAKNVPASEINMLLPFAKYFVEDLELKRRNDKYVIPLLIRNFILESIALHHSPQFMTDENSLYQKNLWIDFLVGFFEKKYGVCIYSLITRSTK